MSRSAALLAAVFGLVAPAAAFAADMNCAFDRFEVSDGRTGDVEWRVVMSNKGKRANVDVIGSGEYDGTSTQAGDSWRYTFDTPSSTEVIEVAQNGRADWKIDFDAGGWLRYTGRCRTGN